MNTNRILTHTAFSLIAVFLLTACFDSELKEIRVQALTGHLVDLPAITDTTQSYEMPAVVWASNWDSVLLNAGLSAGQIKEVRPVAAQADFISPEDSTFRKFEELTFSVVHADETVVVAEIPEDATSVSRKTLELFTPDFDHREVFFESNPQLLLNYARRDTTDTVWTVELLVLWELKGEI